MESERPSLVRKAASTGSSRSFWLSPLLLAAALFCIALCGYWLALTWDKWAAVSWLLDSEHAQWVCQHAPSEGGTYKLDTFDHPVDSRPWKIGMAALSAAAVLAACLVPLLRWRRFCLVIVLPVMMGASAWACAYRFSPFLIEGGMGSGWSVKDGERKATGSYWVRRPGTGWSDVKWYDWVLSQDMQPEGAVGFIFFHLLATALVTASILCNPRPRRSSGSQADQPLGALPRSSSSVGSDSSRPRGP